MTINSSIPKLGRVFIVASSLLISNVFGGYVYDLSLTEYKGGGKGKETKTTILADGSKIKMSGFEESAEMIFDGDTKTMLMLDTKRKSYLQMDEEMIEELSAKLNEAMAEMEKQMASIPAAQRAMMEKMMKNRLPAAPAEKPEVTISRTGETDTISGYKVEKIMVSSSDGTSRELWVTPWEDMKGSEGISNAFSGMAGLVEELMASLSQGPMSGFIGNGIQSSWLDGMEKLEGFPVMSKSFDKSGKLISETILSAVEERDVSASEFGAPKGYKRQKMKM